MYCPECGHHNRESARFCGRCGASLIELTEGEATVSFTPPAEPGADSGVMEAVQRMRRKAQDTGNLKSTPQQAVETQVVESKQVIVIEQADPQVVYVPSYNPTVVYGPPVYPYPPIYYPPPGYYAAGMAVSFGVGVAMGAFAIRREAKASADDLFGRVAGSAGPPSRLRAGGEREPVVCGHAMPLRLRLDGAGEPYAERSPPVAADRISCRRNGVAGSIALAQRWL